jgi:hypothetical protein
MAISIIAASGLMLMYGQSVTALHVQDRHLDMQRQLRMATELIKQDVRLAGFLATPNSLMDTSICPRPATIMRALTITPSDGFVFDNTNNPNIKPSTLTLFGDFSGGTIYMSQSVVGNRIQLINDGTLPNTLEAWDDFFQPHRYVKVTTNEQFDMILPIQSSNFDEKSVTLAETPPTVSPPQMCGVASFGAGYYINVVYFVRYRVVRDLRDGALKHSTVLIREELNRDGLTPVPTSRMIVANDIVDLQFYDFIFDEDQTGIDPFLRSYSFLETIAGSTTVEARLSDGALAIPESLRAMTVKLTSRTPTEDPDYSHAIRKSRHAPIYSFELTGNHSGSCRCSSAATRIQMRSLTGRNLKAKGGLL